MSRKTPSTAAPDDEGQQQPVKRAKHESEPRRLIMDETIQSYRDLEPWQKGMELAERVHGATAAFPVEGDELASRMRDASITIPAALSEAFALESSDHLIGTVGPLAELETCLELAKRLGFLAEDLADDLNARVEAISLSIGRVLETIDQDMEEDNGEYPGRSLPTDHRYDDDRPEPPRRLERQRGPDRYDRDDYYYDDDRSREPPTRPRRYTRGRW